MAQGEKYSYPLGNETEPRPAVHEIAKPNPAPSLNVKRCYGNGSHDSTQPFEPLCGVAGIVWLAEMAAQGHG
jgi:hypothetical protein